MLNRGCEVQYFKHTLVKIACNYYICLKETDLWQKVNYFQFLKLHQELQV